MKRVIHVRAHLRKGRLVGRHFRRTHFDIRSYRVIDNQNPSRNVLITARDKDDALDKGASELKTTNIRVIEITGER